MYKFIDQTNQHSASDGKVRWYRARADGKGDGNGNPKIGEFRGQKRAVLQVIRSRLIRSTYYTTL